jgi:hypothetical protein
MAFAPDGRGKGSLHAFIVSHDRAGITLVVFIDRVAFSGMPVYRPQPRLRFQPSGLAAILPVWRAQARLWGVIQQLGS